MKKLFMLAAAATLMLGGSALAQDKAQNSELKPLLNCHPPSNGAPAWDSQAVEKGCHSIVHRRGRCAECTAPWSVSGGAQRLSAGIERSQSRKAQRLSAQ